MANADIARYDTTQEFNVDWKLYVVSSI